MFTNYYVGEHFFRFSAVSGNFFHFLTVGGTFSQILIVSGNFYRFLHDSIDFLNFAYILTTTTEALPVFPAVVNNDRVH